jgi:Triose-phosphate Transporter family
VKLCITRIWLLLSTDQEKPSDNWSSYLTLVVPIGALTSLDIALSNQSLVFIPVSLYTTIKASLLVYTFLFGVILGLEEFKWQTLLCVVAMAGGLGVAVLSTAHISLYGVGLCSAAAVVGALRWVLVQYLTEKDRERNHVMAVLYKISPTALLTLLPLAIVIEGHAAIQSPFFLWHSTNTVLGMTYSGGDHPSSTIATGFYNSTTAISSVSSSSSSISINTGVSSGDSMGSAGELIPLPLKVLSLCMFGGILSSALIFAEMTLLSATSSLTFSVLGQVKEIIQIILAMIVFNENLSAKSIFGVGFSIAAAAYYRKIKVTELEENVSLGALEPLQEIQDGSVELLIPKPVEPSAKVSASAYISCCLPSASVSKFYMLLFT